MREDGSNDVLRRGRPHERTAAPPRRAGDRRRRRVRRRRPHRRREDRRGGRGRGERRNRRRRVRLPRDAGPDRQPHAPVDAVHGDDVLRRLRHRDAGGGGRRRDLPRRLLDPERARQPALRAGRVAGSRRRRRARRLRLPHGDHQREPVGARRDGADDRGGRLLLQALHGLQGRADGPRRRARGGDGARPRPRRADHGPRRERRRRRHAGQARARARGHLGDQPRAHAAGVRRGRGDRPRGQAGRVHRRVAVRRARDLRVRGGRDRGLSAARRARDRRDLHAVPRQHDRRPAPRRGRGHPLHLLAAAARCAQPRAAVGLRPPRRARERLDRPLPVQLRAEVARARRLQPGAERPARDPAPARQALGRGRRDRRDHAEPARRPHLDHDRAPLRPGRQGRDRARQGRRHLRLRPGRPARLRHRELVHERRLRPLRGRDGERQRAPHVLPRRAGLRPRRDPHAAGPRALRQAQPHARGARDAWSRSTMR